MRDENVKVEIILAAWGEVKFDFLSRIRPLPLEQLFLLQWEVAAGPCGGDPQSQVTFTCLPLFHGPDFPTLVSRPRHVDFQRCSKAAAVCPM